MTQAWELSLSEAARLVAAREISPVEVVESVLARAESVDDRIGAFETLVPHLALDEARKAESDIARGRWRGPLHGMPVSVKDVFDVAGVATTASSRVPTGPLPERDAAAVARLRNAGAVVIGKTRTHEFAFGFTTPGTRNPWNTAHIAGGSSGGAAAAVMAGAGVLGLASDTAGSIRNPAAQCGAVGLKPTFGSIGRTGMVPLSWSLDHAGVIGRTVQDVAHAFSALASHDARDPGSVPTTPLDVSAVVGADIRGVHIGVPVGYLQGRIDPVVDAAVGKGVDVLRSAGAQVREIELPLDDFALAVGFGIVLPEAAASHATMLRRYADHYTDETRMLLEAGSPIGSGDHLRALRARALLRSSWREMFRSGVDVVVTPTVPVTAAHATQTGFTWADGVEENLVVPVARATFSANLTGLPALSVPCGFSEGLPLGMQLTGRPFAEATVLQVGHAFEAATQWSRMPLLPSD